MVVLNTVQLWAQHILWPKQAVLYLAGASAATSYGIKKTTGYTPGEHINSLVKNNSSLNGRGNTKRVPNNPLFIFK